MSVLTSLYAGMSGMEAYQQGLAVIGNNTANLNTAGFKFTEPVFEDVATDSGSGGFTGSPATPAAGGGVQVDTTHVSFSPGNEQPTGDPLDAAINGLGFFMVDLNGTTYYTRSGAFQFDAGGDLVETATGAKVLVSTSTSANGTFNVKAYNSYPPKATNTVQLTGNLARTGQTTSYNLPGITVVDGAGGTQTLQASFTQSTTNPLSWTVQVNDSKGTLVGSGTILFGADGSPDASNTPIQLTVTPPGLPAFKVSLSIGTAGSFSGVTSLNTTATSQLQVASQDGVQLGSLTGTSFGNDGSLTLTYSNGKTQTPAKLLLAQFNAPQQLRELSKGLFAATSGTTPLVGTPESTNFGNIVGGEIEMSNVDLSQQFTELIVIQRGYQASSQITSIANDMMQQLLTMGNNHG
jgi:flagellar hook protein FlgE